MEYCNCSSCVAEREPDKPLTQNAIDELHAVRKHILEQPKRFQMARWILNYVRDHWETPQGIEVKNPELEIPVSVPPCNTAACIAGWVTLRQDPSNDDPEEYAKAFLALSRNQARRLFVPSHWPAQFRLENIQAGTRRYARIASARIKHFIATDGKE